MAITQQQYGDVYLRASMVHSDAVYELYKCETIGCNSDWSNAVCFWRKLKSAAFCLSIQDFISDESVAIYNALLSYAGLEYITGLTPDPNAQPIGNVIIDIQGGTGRALKVVSDPSSTNLSKSYLNATYPYDDYQEGDIVYVPAVNLQYTKLENTVDSDWNEAPFNYAQ